MTNRADHTTGSAPSGTDALDQARAPLASAFSEWSDADLVARIVRRMDTVARERRTTERRVEHHLDCIAAARAELTRRLVVFVPETSSWRLDADRADALPLDPEAQQIAREAALLVRTPDMIGAPV